MDNFVGVSRSITDSVVEERVGVFPILLMNSWNSSLMALRTSSVDSPVQDALPDSAIIDLMASFRVE